MKRVIISICFSAVFLLTSFYAYANRISSEASLVDFGAEGTNTFTAEEYQKLVKGFYEKNYPSETIPRIDEKITFSTAELTRIIGLLGLNKTSLKKTKVSSIGIDTVDLSWTNMKQAFVGKNIQSDRARKLNALIEETDGVSCDSFSLTQTQINSIISLCLDGNDALFDLSGLDSANKTHFKRHLGLMLKIYTGFKRIMSLLAVSILNSTEYAFDKGFSRVGVVVATGDNGYNDEKKRIEIKNEIFEGSDHTILHEISHVYHNMILLKPLSAHVPDILDPNGANLLGLFFPMLTKDKIDAAVEEIVRRIDELNAKTVSVKYDVGDIKSCISAANMKTVKDMFKAIVDAGFGGLFFSKSDTNLDIGASVLTKETLAKVIYVYCAAVYTASLQGKTVFTNCEEMLTIVGFAPVTDGYGTYLFEDRQNEEIYRIRQQEDLKKNSECSNQFRYHYMLLNEDKLVNDIVAKIYGIFERGAGAPTIDTSKDSLKKVLRDSLKQKTFRFVSGDASTPTKPATPTQPVVTPTKPATPTQPVVIPTKPVTPTQPVVTPTQPATPSVNDDGIFDLIQNGSDVGEIESVLNAATVNSKDEVGRTPLHLASANGRTDVVTLLLNKGANVKATDQKNLTPLHNAASGGHDKIAELLLNKGAAVDAKDNSGKTPLHVASASGRAKVVTLLLSKKANAKAVDGTKLTPLHEAAFGGHDNVVTLLLATKGIVIDAKDNKNSTPLHLASANGSAKVVTLLLKKRARADLADNRKLTPLHLAAKNGSLEVVKLLLDKKSIVYRIIETILRRKLNINAADETKLTPLHLAASGGYDAIVSFLIDNKATVDAKDSNSSTPLHLASANGKTKVVSVLLAKKAAVDAKDKSGKTPLNLASANGHEEVVALLLGKNANVKAADKQKLTPLHSAASNGHTKVVELLLTKGLDVNAKDASGETPLHLATKNSQSEIVELLLNVPKINTVVKDSTGKTPAEWASSIGFNNVAKILENISTDPSSINTAVKDASGKTPAEWASSIGLGNVAEQLKSVSKSVLKSASKSASKSVLKSASKSAPKSTSRARKK